MKLDSLRNRLILSHIVPLVVMIPLVGVALVYLLETQVLLPQLAAKLVGDARLLNEITRSEYELWGNPYFFQLMLSRVQLDPDVRVMFLTPDGRMLYSSDPADDGWLGRRIEPAGLESAQQGEEAVLTNYSILRLNNVLIDVLSPVVDARRELVGIVRVTYQIASLYELLSQSRYLIAIVLAFGLLLGAVIGSMLAVTIGRPVQRVTQAIYDVASGSRERCSPRRARRRCATCRGRSTTWWNGSVGWSWRAGGCRPTWCTSWEGRLARCARPSTPCRPGPGMTLNW